jgi:dTDP-4-amino-4,6-dideoxygalactose transaminase
MNYFKPISISLSPNVEKDDVHLALHFIIRPWLWQRGKAKKELEEQFSRHLGVSHSFAFNSGRSSFFALLKALDLDKGSEVILQAFTCNAVPNPILWAGLEPVYVDCNKDDFNMDVADLASKITEKTKVVVLQYTFGLPANIEAVQKICKEKKLILVEDCAHALGAEYHGKKVGTFGDAAFFSFSRDKVISSVYGGMAVVNNAHVAKKVVALQHQFGEPSNFWIFQQLLHPILLYYIILPVYAFFDLGKVMLVASQLLHLLSKAVSWEEKQGKQPDYFPKALPNALAMLAFHQFNKLGKFNARRKTLAEWYYHELKDTKFELPKQFSERKNIFLRFAVQHPKAHDIIYEAWSKQNILIGDWYTTVIAPFDTNMKEMKYKSGSCKNAEWLAKRTLNLPTHINISERDAKRIITFLKTYA